MMKRIISFSLVAVGLVACDEPEVVDRTIAGDRSEVEVAPTNEISYSKIDLLGRWRADWMNDPEGVGSTSIYEYRADGTMYTYYTGKSTSTGTWDIAPRQGEQVLIIKAGGSPQFTGLSATTWCRIEGIDKNSFDVKGWYNDELLVNSNHIRFTRIIE